MEDRYDRSRPTSDAKESRGDNVPEVSMMERDVAVMVLKAVAGFIDHRQNCTAQPDTTSSWLSLPLPLPTQN